MQTWFARWAGRGRRSKLILAAGVLLVIVAAGAAILALRPAPLKQVAGALPGAVSGPPAGAVALPGLTAGKDSPFSIRPAADERFCLAATTEGLDVFQLKYHVRAYACQNDWNFTWYFRGSSSGAPAYQPRLVEVVRDSNSTHQYCLDVEGGSLSAGATVTTFYCKSQDYQNQLWYLVAGSRPGQYKLYANQSRKCLALSEALTESNHPYLVQKDCQDAPEFIVQAIPTAK